MKSNKYPFQIIAAIDADRGIGKNGSLPWVHPSDLSSFKRKTDGHVLIMGRKTHESIGFVLKGRVNIVMSRDESYRPSLGAFKVNSQEEASDIALSLDASPFVIGGREIYKLFMPMTGIIHLTEIDKRHGCDTFMPVIDMEKWETEAVEGNMFLKFSKLKRIGYVRPVGF